MKPVISSLLFFTTVRLHSPFMMLAVAVAAFSAITMVIADSSKGAEALVPLAFVQMFASSSGFAVPARRGHLDLLLTGGSPRWQIAATHFVVSIVPGMLAWMMVALVEAAVARTLSPKALSSGTFVAFGVISTIAWALTVWLPRLSGAIAWLLAMAVWFVGWFDLGHPLVIIICPFLLLGTTLGGDRFAIAWPVMALAAVLSGLAMMWIVRTDVPLESAQ
jgi:hypothetical protein